MILLGNFIPFYAQSILGGFHRFINNLKYQLDDIKDIQCVNRSEIKKLWHDTEELTNQRTQSPTNLGEVASRDSWIAQLVST